MTGVGLTGHSEMAILAIMETATITQVKNGLSAYIDRVKAGESILVTDRGPTGGNSRAGDRPGRLG